MITGGFGYEFDIETGLSRKWYMQCGDVKRWADNGEPVMSESERETDISEKHKSD